MLSTRYKQAQWEWENLIVFFFIDSIKSRDHVKHSLQTSAMRVTRFVCAKD